MRFTSVNTAVLLLGPIAFFVLFFVAPFALLVGESFTRPDGGMTLANYVARAQRWLLLEGAAQHAADLVLGDGGLLRARLSARLLHGLSRAQSVWVRRVIYVLLVTPLFTSNIVRAFGWIVILGRRGIVNTSLIAIGLIETPLDLLYSKTQHRHRAVLHPAARHGCSPSAACCRPSIASLIEAARDLGARPSRAFLAVTFPLSLPGVVAGSIIVFALSVSAYVIPSILSGGREMVTPILIFQQYTATFRPDIGATLSVVLLVVTLLLIGAYLFFLERRAEGGACDAHEPEPCRSPRPPARSPASAASCCCTWRCRCWSSSPSRSRRPSISSSRRRGSRWRWYWKVVSDPTFVEAFVVSSQLAAAATATALLLGVPAALVFARKQFRGAQGTERRVPLAARAADHRARRRHSPVRVGPRICPQLLGALSSATSCW